MKDLVFVITTVALFTAAIAYTYGCDRLTEGSKHA